MLKIYEYSKCGTCRKAIKFLDSRGISYQMIPIRENPPTKSELKKMLVYVGGDLKKLFNTSGQDYRKMKIKDKIKDMTQAEVFELLSKNGNLIKRPFVLDNRMGTVGFKEDEWKKLFSNRFEE